ncbi:MAG: hypothetical protein SFZ03_04530, partial [Candidatus Melainabacteria bacterium]|nr:hypothetical protein [Candidatus Melainabacteria bacterium]
FSAAIETAAASGATNLYLAQLDAVIKTLEAQPTASTETIANLKALSTQGHQIAGIQKLLEEQAKANPDTFKDQQFEWNGKTYTLGQMARLVGGGASPEEVALQPFNPPQHIAMERTEVLKFINLYKQIENSNQLQPEVQQAVKKLAGNIIFSGELTEDIIGYHTSRGRIEADKIREAMLSRVTEVNANGICTIGQGKRNGQSCQ